MSFDANAPVGATPRYGPVGVGGTLRGGVAMLAAAGKDLYWRRRRFAIVVAGTTLVFSVTLLLGGIRQGFQAEISHTIAQIGAGTYVVPEGSTGPFLGQVPIQPSDAKAIVSAIGPDRAGPMLYTHNRVERGGRVTDVNVFGLTPGGPVFPRVTRGRVPAGPGQIVISTTLHGYPVGSAIDIGGRSFRVTGTVGRSTVLAGVANVFMSLPDLQRLSFNGADVVTSVAVAPGPPVTPPPGFRAMDRAQAAGDLARPIAQARSTIGFLSYLLWLVATVVIGSAVYISAMERTRDFAVFKAIGLRQTQILAGLLLQAVAMALLAAILGELAARLLVPVVAMQVSITTGQLLALPLIAVVVGGLASVFGMRRVAVVDPALAFGGP